MQMPAPLRFILITRSRFISFYKGGKMTDIPNDGKNNGNPGETHERDDEPTEPEQPNLPDDNTSSCGEVIRWTEEDSHTVTKSCRRHGSHKYTCKHKFIYETDNVLSDYIPDHLSEAVIEVVAKDLIEREKQKNTVKSREGTEYEVIKSEEANCLLCKHTDGIPTYCRAYIILQNAKDMDFSDDWISEEVLNYSDMNKAYVDSIEENRTDKLVREKFDEEYINFKKAMVSKSPIDVFELCYKIAAMEDVYFYVTGSKKFTPEEKEPESIENEITSSSSAPSTFILSSDIENLKDRTFTAERSEI